MNGYYSILFLCLFLISCQSGKKFESNVESKSWDVHGKLEVSGNGHFLQHENGTPFLWLGGTLWGMAEWTSREDIDKYLDNRKNKGFNVIQVCLLWGKRHEDPVRFPVNAENAYGQRALKYTDSVPDPAIPDVRVGGSPTNPNDYWDHVDYLIQAAADRDIYIGLLPVWGRRYVNASHPEHSVKLFNKENARIYGSFLGERYKDAPNIIWVLGGDVNAMSGGDHRNVYRVMAEGIIKGITEKDASWNEPHPAWDAALFTYHPDGYPTKNSSEWFHMDPWLDFNMIETHIWRDSLYSAVLHDYNLAAPVKPSVMGEGHYEGFTNKKYADGIAIRRQAYQTFFAGGAGHTYGGHHDGNGNGPLFSPYVGWESMLEMEGVQCFPILKKILEEQEWWIWVPDTSIVKSNSGSGELRKVSVKHRGGKKALVYFPEKSASVIDLSFYANSDNLSLTWINTKDGTTADEPVDIQNLSMNLEPPGNWMDAVLVIEVKN